MTTVSRSEASRSKRKRARSRLLMKINVALIALLFVLVAVVLWKVWDNRDGNLPGQASSGVADGVGNTEQAQGGKQTDGDTGQQSESNTEVKGNAGSETGQPNDSGAGNETETGSGPGTETGSASGNGEQEPAVTQTDESAGVHLTFVGDIMFSDKVASLLQDKGYDYPYANVNSYFEKADLSVANLETPVTLHGVPEQEKEYVYKSSPDALPALARAGIDLVNVANNHSMDQGWPGLKDTLQALDDNGIMHVGGGANAEEAFKPAIVESKGIKIAFLGFTKVVPNTSWKAGSGSPGLADTYDYKKPVEAIANAKRQADLVVVIAHWGEERNDNPVAHQTDLAHRYIDAGADLVVASHPHVLQGFEQYKNKWIAYSLGNFIFTTNSNPKTWNSAIVEARCSKTGDCGLQVVPILTKWAQPAVMNETEGAELFKHLSDISINAEVAKDGTVKAK